MAIGQSRKNNTDLDRIMKPSRHATGWCDRFLFPVLQGPGRMCETTPRLTRNLSFQRIGSRVVDSLVTSNSQGFTKPVSWWLLKMLKQVHKIYQKIQFQWFNDHSTIGFQVKHMAGFQDALFQRPLTWRRTAKKNPRNMACDTPCWRSETSQEELKRKLDDADYEARLWEQRECDM